VKLGGYSQIILATCILGLLGIFVRLIELPTLVLVFYRVLFAAILLFFPCTRGKEGFGLFTDVKLAWALCASPRPNSEI